MVADLALKQGDHAAVLVALDQTKNVPRDYRFYYRRAIALDRLERPAEADAAYRAAHNRASNDAERLNCHVALANGAEKRQAWPAAQESYSAALRLKPESVALARGVARSALAQKDYTLAARVLSVVVAKTGDPVEREQLANVYATQRDFLAAAREYTLLLPTLSNPELLHRTYRNLGFAYSNLGRTADAAEAFRKAAEIEGDRHTLISLAEAQQRSGARAEAIQTLERIVMSDADPQLRLRLFALYAERGDVEMAAKHLDAAARSKPSVELDRMLGESYLAIGEKTKGVFHLERAAERHNSAPLDRRLGELYMASGNYALAARYLERVPQSQPSPELFVQLGNIYALTQENELAATRFEQAVASSTEPQLRREVYEQLGFIYVKLGRDKQAAEAFQRALDAGADGARFLVDMGLAQFRLVEWKAAASQFERALEHNPAPTTHLYAARAYQKLSQPDAAVAHLRQAVQSNAMSHEEFPVIYKELGFMELSLGDKAAAAQAWRQLLAFQSDADIELALAQTELDLGRAEVATLLLEGIDTTRLNANDKERYRDLLADAYGKAGESEKAIEALEDAIKLEATSERRYRLGIRYLHAGRPDEAMQQLEAAHAEVPENNQYAESLAYAYRAKGRNAEAADLFDVVLTRDPSRTALYRDAAYANMQARRNEQAARLFRLAIDDLAAKADGVRPRREAVARIVD
jgi:tetratricopeptide (TPR) repeat protein